ncbi:Hypothetical protein FKW44_024696, partial [Caligus rogercresseyi]
MSNPAGGSSPPHDGSHSHEEPPYLQAVKGNTRPDSSTKVSTPKSIPQQQESVQSSVRVKDSVVTDDVTYDSSEIKENSVNGSSRFGFWNFFRILIKKEDNSFPTESEFLDFDVAEIAIHKLGIPAYELSHITSEMGPGRALIGVKRPIELIKKFKDIELPFEYIQKSSKNKFTVDIIGLKNAITYLNTKTFRVQAMRCVGRVSEEDLVNSMKLFAEDVKKVGYF